MRTGRWSTHCWHTGDSLSGIGGEKRPGIVHRIDKDTSGLIIAAKNDYAHAALAAQLKDHSLARTYVCIVCGNIKDAGTIDAPIGRHPADRKKMAVTEKNSRSAVTHWRVLERFSGYTLVECKLETGRTHQIRVHIFSQPRFWAIWSTATKSPNWVRTANACTRRNFASCTRARESP